MRFFPVTQLTMPTMPCTTDTECAFDEICVFGGKCAPRSTERRFCMLTCASHGDCRGGYECRDLKRMAAHGGMPVSAPDVNVSADPPEFCAAAKPCTKPEDCDLGDVCDLASRLCERP